MDSKVWWRNCRDNEQRPARSRVNWSYPRVASTSARFEMKARSVKLAVVDVASTRENTKSLLLTVVVWPTECKRQNLGDGRLVLCLPS